MLRPPLLGVDVVGFRESAWRKKVPVFVLAREPMTRAGKWPMVAVAEMGSLKGGASGMRSVRAMVGPPVGVALAGDAADDRVPSLEWFTAAGEAIGDAAIAAVDRSLHPAFQADDLMDFLAAIPEHEKLHQRLEEVCREAARVGAPEGKRKVVEENPWSF